MSKILLSIKPEYVEKIFDGSKRYEFRRKIPKKKVNTVVIYATAPISMVVGEFKVADILCSDILSLYDETDGFQGISMEEYISYFNDIDMGYAYVIENAIEYEHYLSILKYGLTHHPQAFVYLD